MDSSGQVATPMLAANKKYSTTDGGVTPPCLEFNQSQQDAASKQAANPDAIADGSISAKRKHPSGDMTAGRGQSPTQAAAATAKDCRSPSVANSPTSQNNNSNSTRGHKIVHLKSEARIDLAMVDVAVNNLDSRVVTKNPVNAFNATRQQVSELAKSSSSSIANDISYSTINSNDRSGSRADEQANSTLTNRYRPQKYCAVCGDKAIACNFNAVTCESCKAFFRRNAFKEQRLKCLFDSRCVIDKVTRRFCSKCRLLKCFEIGMKREWILTDEQKQVKRVKIMQNKQTKQQQQQQVSTSSLDSEDQTTNQGPRSSNSSASSTNGQLSQSSDGGGPTVRLQLVAGETLGSLREPRRRSSFISNHGADCGAQSLVEKRDASTSCPDEADLLSGQTQLHYCSMAHQCQYCSLRLHQSDVPQLNRPNNHSMDSYQANYHFHHQSRQHFDYHHHHHHHRHQQQQLHHQAAHLIHYNAQQPASDYASSQASTASVAYSQHQMAAAAAAHTMFKTVSGGAYQTATPVSNQPAASLASSCGPAMGPLPHAADRCCLSIDEFIQNQRYNRPSNAGSSSRDDPQASPTGPSVVNHFANQAQAFSPNANVKQPDLHTMETPAQSGTNLGTKKDPALAGVAGTNLSQTLPSATNSAAADDSSKADTGLRGQQKECRVNSPSLDSQGTTNLSSENCDPTGTKGSEVSNRKDEEGGCSDEQHAQQTASRDDHQQRATAENSQAKSATKTTDDNTSSSTKESSDNKTPTMPDGSALDTSKYICWMGIVYAQPAIAEIEMRARAERIDFTETERQLVYEMMDATRCMFEPSGVDRLFIDESLNDFVYFCDDALRRLIKTVKQIRAFRILGMDDQIMLLKSACFKILLLRSCLHYHDDIEGWRDRQGRIIPLKALKKAKSFVYDKHKEIMARLSAPLRKDRIVMGFMALVLLFESQDSLKHTNSVGLDNLVYLCILRKYLIGTQPEPLEKYERLVESMQMINACVDEYNVFFSRNFLPEQITPLLIEIFDISINNPV